MIYRLIYIKIDYKQEVPMVYQNRLLSLSSKQIVQVHRLKTIEGRVSIYE